MMFKKHIVIYLFIFIGSLAKAQTCSLTLKGSIRDEDNGEHLGFALVKLLSPEKISQSNSSGEFSFDGLCQGEYKLLIKHAGCRDTLFVVKLNKSAHYTFKLPHAYNTLNDIEISTKHENAKPMQSEQSMDTKALDKTRGQSLGDQLKQMNGVTTFNTGSTISKPMINGMQGYRVLILNNGIRQEGQQWGNEHAPEIDPFIAQRLSVLRGASAVRYGSDAIGGVVIVEPNELPDTVSVTGELNTIGIANGRGGVASLQLEGCFEKIKKLSWRVQGTAKKTGTIKTPEYYLKNTGTEEKNFSVALGYHGKKLGLSVFYSQFNSSVGIFSGAHIGNLTDLYAAFNSSKPQDSAATFAYEIGRPNQSITHELLKLSADLHTGLRSRLYFNYAWQYDKRQEYDKHLPRNNDLAALNLPELDYRINSQNAELVWEHNYIKSFRGKFGTQAMYQENVYLGRFFIPNYANKTIGLFAIERLVRAKYEIEAGLRGDYKNLNSYYYVGTNLQSPELTFKNMSFNLGAIYKPGLHTKFNLNLANGWRAPAVNELYSNGLHHGVGAIERGDPNLKTEYCTNVITTAIIEYKNFRAEGTAYYYHFTNFIYYLPGERPELTIRGAFPVFNYKQNNASISGGDILVNYSITPHMSIKQRGMWVRGTNRDLNQPLIYMPADRYETALIFTFKNKVKLKDTYIEPTWMYVCRQYRVPAGTDFVAPPAAYHLFGLNAGTTFKIKKQPFIVTLSVNNAANTIYRDYLDRFRYFNDAQGTNVTLRLRLPIFIYHKPITT
jgi:iron complex outermembrane recepter protein